MIPHIPLSWIVTGLAVLALGGYIWHCESVKDDMVAAEALARHQAELNARKAEEALRAKERADETYERNLSRLRADVERLRQSRTDFVPPAAPASPSPDRACFSRAELERALRKLDSGVQDLVREGDEARIGLDAAKAAWPKP